jgi:4-amino-4-deoxy-L-arabinose transferase-like glycosyltransferase
MLLLLAAFAGLFELSRMDVVTDNEGQRAAPPSEMLRTNDYVIPKINGVGYLAKPPLLYWAIAGVYHLTGAQSALTARIPTALCGVGLVLTVYWLFRREAGEGAARWAALTLLASFYLLERMRLAELDVPLTWMTFLAIMALRRAWLAPPLLPALAAGFALGAAVLLKGPVPFLFLGAAWLAHLVATGTDPDKVMRQGLRWTAVALTVEVAMKSLAALMRLFAVRGGEWLDLSPETTRVLSQGANLLGVPVALVLTAGIWFWLAWRHGGPQRGPVLARLLAVCAVGIALAAPWSATVVARKGWPYVQELLRAQVWERTYTASEINWGTPFYFVVALPFMLAPWGFLLPLHFSRGLWHRLPPLYRFSLLTGWFSVLVFSLIAGKEYEYILPAVPFLLGVTGYVLAEVGEDGRDRWIARVVWVWLHVSLLGLTVLAIAGALYAAAKMPWHITLQIDICILAIVALGVALYTARRPEQRLAGVFALSLLVILMYLVGRGYHYTGRNSPKELAVLCRSLISTGYTVEASKVYPAFAFYAGTPIPVRTSSEEVRTRLEGSEPYYYLTRERDLNPQVLATATKPPVILTPAYTSKRLILIGNSPLPQALGIPPPHY